MREQHAWQEADAILDRLLDLRDEERDAALMRFGVDPEIRRRAVQLLEGHRRAAGILDGFSALQFDPLRQRLPFLRRICLQWLAEYSPSDR